MSSLKMWSLLLVTALAVSVIGCGNNNEGNDKKGDASERAWPRDGSAERPLLVMLIPADGGTEEGTIADFRPVFNAVSRSTGLQFDLRVGQSYSAVVEAMSNDQIDIAFFGPVTYYMTRERGAAQLLAVSVTGGSSTYYAGIFVREDSSINSLTDLKGKSIAVGDSASTSSFTYPIAMMMDAGVDPVNDLERITITGSHVNSLLAVAEGRADAGCASFDSLERAINAGHIPAGTLRPLQRSDPIPNPPLAMHTKLPDSMKKQLLDAFANVHTAEGVTPDMIRGYGGSRVDSYDTAFSEEEFGKAAAMLDQVEQIKGEILAKAGGN
jgi:phosphonate transport system substrate-binding protein